MADQSLPNEITTDEAVYGIKAGVKDLQQLSSSGKAAQEKRQGNHRKRAMGALDSAIKDHLSRKAPKEIKLGKLGTESWSAQSPRLFTALG